MAWLAKATATQFLSRATALSATHAADSFSFAWCIWFSPCGSTENHGLFHAGETTGTQAHSTWGWVDDDRDWRAVVADATATDFAAATGLYATATWNFFYGGYEGTSTVHTVRTNNDITQDFNNTAIDTNPWTFFHIPVGFTPTAGIFYGDGNFAEFACWASGLSTGDQDSLASGALPETIGGTSFLRCWPLLEDFLDTDASGVLTENGVTSTGFNISATHPLNRATASTGEVGVQPYMMHMLGQMGPT